MAACDLAIASERASFGTSGVKLGLFCATPSVPLSRNIGRKRAFEMLVTGGFIEAQRAKEWGLVNQVVDPEELEESVERLVLDISDKPAVAISMGKVGRGATLDRSCSLIDTQCLLDGLTMCGLPPIQNTALLLFAAREAPPRGVRPGRQRHVRQHHRAGHGGKEGCLVGSMIVLLWLGRSKPDPISILPDPTPTGGDRGVRGEAAAGLGPVMGGCVYVCTERKEEVVERGERERVPYVSHGDGDCEKTKK